MAFLVRRGKRARAGWSDNFTRPDESPVQEPWQFWGDVANYSIVGEKLQLGAPGVSRPARYDGGVAFEHQPLTPNWVLEFVRLPTGTSSESSSNVTEMNVFLDKNWTEGGGNAASTPYQVLIQINAKYTPEKKPDSEGNGGRDEDMDYYVQIATRDKVNTTSGPFGFTYLGSIGGATDSIGVSEWLAPMRIKLVVYNDRYMLLYINDQYRLFVDLYTPNFRFGPKKRAANFAQINGLVNSIDEFKTYDLPDGADIGIRETWTEQFYDSFNRTTSSTVGNGWTQTTGDWFGIYSNGLSMRLAPPFNTTIGTDGFRQVRRNVGSSDMKVEFVLGGDGTGAPNTGVQTTVLGRLSSDGKRGLCVSIRHRTLWIGGVTWGGGLKDVPVLDGNPSFIDLGIADPRPVLSQGVRWSLNIVGDHMWLKNEDIGRVTQFREGVNNIVPASPDNTWAGAIIMRNLLTNSVSIGEMRLWVP